MSKWTISVSEAIILCINEERNEKNTNICLCQLDIFYVFIEGEKVEAVKDFFFLGCKITANGDCSHEIKRQLLLGRKAMTN